MTIEQKTNGGKMYTSMIKCSCGQTLAHKDAVCSSCGYDYGRSHEQQQMNEKLDKIIQLLEKLTSKLDE